MTMPVFLIQSLPPYRRHTSEWRRSLGALLTGVALGIGLMAVLSALIWFGPLP